MENLGILARIADELQKNPQVASAVQALLGGANVDHTEGGKHLACVKMTDNMGEVHYHPIISILNPEELLDLAVNGDLTEEAVFVSDNREVDPVKDAEVLHALNDKVRAYSLMLSSSSFRVNGLKLGVEVVPVATETVETLLEELHKLLNVLNRQVDVLVSENEELSTVGLTPANKAAAIAFVVQNLYTRPAAGAALTADNKVVIKSQDDYTFDDEGDEDCYCEYCDCECDECECDECECDEYDCEDDDYEDHEEQYDCDDDDDKDYEDKEEEAQKRLDKILGIFNP